MKQIIGILFLSLSFVTFGQQSSNQTLNYSDLIKVYKELAKQHSEIELYAMGESDYGLPIYLCIVNGAQDSIKSFEKARNSTTLFINNAIHPGEPDGVNACLGILNDWITNGKQTAAAPVLAIIPAYNVGGMLVRSGTSRANQNGPEEYGFRGNAQNLDLNRDFVKMDSKNMFTFAKIYHALEPDIFIDTHVSNGADYQYVVSYIASVKERMAPGLSELMHQKMLPFLKSQFKTKEIDLIPYVDLKDETPESGIQVFNDLPRYSMGYAAMMNSISFTIETHMLKPFDERVAATKEFIIQTIQWATANSVEIEKERENALKWERDLKEFEFNFQLTEKKDSILFKGFEFSRPISEVTGLPRLKYHQDRPYEKYVPYYKTYVTKSKSHIPDFFILGGQNEEVVKRLKANQFKFEVLTKDTVIQLGRVRIDNYETVKKPYEGHYLHSDVSSNISLSAVKFKKGDILIPAQQRNKRFLVSLMESKSEDSYFNWNFFDSYIQQKEYFSPYVFEDQAVEILKNNLPLKEEFEAKKKRDPEFAKSEWNQLYFIYSRSKYFEPSLNLLPIFEGMYKGGE
ncbi:MAG: M14 family zinc carboxypeptidase [Crocinitomicaceae bacterium]